MAIASSKTRLITGAFPLSAYTTSVEPVVSRATFDRTSLVDEHLVFSPGLRSSALTVNTMLDDSTTAGGYWATLTGFYDNSTLVPVTVSPNGIALDSPVFMAEGHLTTMTGGSEVAAGVDAALTFTTTGLADAGKNLVSHDALTQTTTGSNLDGGASSSNGGVAHLHVTAISGSTPTLDVVIEHSANGSSGWTTIATFTQVTTSVAAQRVVVAPGTTVNRYLRAKATIAGTNPSYTISVAFARR